MHTNNKIEMAFLDQPNLEMLLLLLEGEAKENLVLLKNIDPGFQRIQGAQKVLDRYIDLLTKAIR